MNSKIVFVICNDQFEGDEMYCLVGDLNSVKEASTPFTTTVPIFVDLIDSLRDVKITYPNGLTCSFAIDHLEMFSQKFVLASTTFETTNRTAYIFYYNVDQIKG